MREVARFLLQERPAQILLAAKRLKSPYISTLAKDVDCTYAHASRVVKKMGKLGLVKLNQRGRVKFVTLTPGGEKAAAALQRIANLGEN
ncbi:MAG: MarR family winged helix-turn-helix transcriptional regulator [Halobacteria archaeon]|jgi:DNA-binding MarR family transcriptional regulator